MRKVIDVSAVAVLAGVFLVVGSTASAGVEVNGTGEGTEQKPLYLHVPIGDMPTENCTMNGEIRECGVVMYDPQTPNDLLVQYITLVYGYLKMIIATLASLIVVAGGVMMAMSGGNGEKVAQGKALIIRALVSLGVFIVLGLILEAINPEMFG